MNVLSFDIGVSNFAVCALRVYNKEDKKGFDVIRLQVWNLGNQRAVPAYQFVDRLIEHIHAWELLESGWMPDKILIEQQVKGAHMNVALAFSAYALCKIEFPHACTRFVHPLEKLKGFKRYIDLPGELGQIEKLPNDYKGRKRLAIVLAEEILKSAGHDALYKQCPGFKQDDIADALLQSFC